MRIRNKAKAFYSFLGVKFFKKRVPLAVRWQLTNRCVLNCRYCNIGQTHQEELTLDEIVAILDQMSILGTQTISFSGGEPMLRQDIGEILAETAKRGISTEMNSTGAMIPSNFNKLKYLDFLKISLDGPENVHDFLRGKNSYKMAIAAASASREHKLRFIFTTTLTKYNINEVKFLLDKAREYDTLVAFQPLKSLYRGVTDVSFLEPSKDDFKCAINYLIEQKKLGNAYLRNSLIGLRHIYDWPHYSKLECWAGRIFCILNTDGSLVPCDRIVYSNKIPNCRKNGFIEAFNNLSAVCCDGCGFCGVLELNFMMALRFGAIESIYKVIK